MKPKYLIIAGTNKAGTTSLFNYLSDHPDICGSTVKQTLFFIDKDYKGVLSQALTHYDHDPEGYTKFFKDAISEKYWLEASPDYLYSPGTPERIHSFAENKSVELIFILRDPLDRFLSWYYHARRANMIDVDISLKDFIEFSLNTDNNCALATNTLITGNYSKFIKHYLTFFPKESINIIFFEELIHSPKDIMNKLCDSWDISNSYYSDYNFKKHNMASDTKNIYVHYIYKMIRNNILKISHNYPLLYKLTKSPRRLGSFLYKKINQKPVIKDRPDDVSIQNLTIYYQTEYEELTQLLDKKIPWIRYKLKEA